LSLLYEEHKEHHGDETVEVPKISNVAQGSDTSSGKSETGKNSVKDVTI